MRFAPIPAALPATVPFTGPEHLERVAGLRFRARLGANESGFGPSPRALDAMRQAAAEAWMYGDPDNHDLRVALAAAHGVTPAHVMVGEGIDGLLDLLVRLFVAPGDAVVAATGAYPTFLYHVAGHGGLLHQAPYRAFAPDLPALAALARRVGARLTYLSNPDNPMGGVFGHDAVAAFLETLPADGVLVLDEAYAEFAAPDALPRIDPDDPRVVRMRTFSKAYGLAGARVGHAIGHPDLIAGFDRIRNHFGVNRIGQAGALAALADRAWLDRVVADTAAARDRIAALCAAEGFAPLLSATNFVAADTHRDGAFTARVVAALAARGVFIRRPGTPGLDRCLRISAGPPTALDILAAEMPAAVREAG